MLAAAWVPAHFGEDQEPYAGGPLPFSRRHRLSSADSYFVLALIHDAERQDASRISPFGPDDGQKLAIESEDGQMWVFWHIMALRVPMLCARNQTTLDDCLARVVADLAQPESERNKARQRGRPPDRDATKDRRVKEAWKTGRYKSYDELSKELGVPRRQVQLAIDAERKRQKRQRKL
jgi:hypothetical protein